jgi:hypothetical protein
MTGCDGALVLTGACRDVVLTEGLDELFVRYPNYAGDPVVLYRWLPDLVAAFIFSTTGEGRWPRT